MCPCEVYACQCMLVCTWVSDAERRIKHSLIHPLSFPAPKWRRLGQRLCLDPGRTANHGGHQPFAIVSAREPSKTPKARRTSEIKSLYLDTERNERLMSHPQEYRGLRRVMCALRRATASSHALIRGSTEALASVPGIRRQGRHRRDHNRSADTCRY